MAQYRYYTESGILQYCIYNDLEYDEFTDGIDTFRTGNRDNSFVIDKALNTTGFAGVEGVDWEEVEYATTGPATGAVRDGYRDNKYVVDTEISVTGFSGTENIDWVNLQTHS